jgi:outer membrane lipoprotein-sorting protein
MKPADKIKELINKSYVRTTPETDDRILDGALEHLEKLKQKKSAVNQPNIWRIIMKNPLTKVAIASVLAIACLTGLFLWKSTGSGIALADVLTRIEQVTAYMYQMRSTVTKQQTSTDLISTVLISQENGLKITTKRIDTNNNEINSGDTYILPKLNSVIFVVHEEKMYVRLKFDDTKLAYYKEEYNDPRIIIKQILSCDHTSLGQSVIDGITVEGFLTTDSAYDGGFMGYADFEGRPEKVDVKLWVDVNTFLPVRLEEDIVMKKGTRMHEVSYDFRWNVVVSADDFKPVIPEGYMSSGEIVVPAVKEENAIKGLRLFASLAGEYPDNLDTEILNREARGLIGLVKDSFEEIADDEKKKKKLTGELISMMGPAFFYEKLVYDNKNPAYYGQTVGPDDTNKVLMRWKLDNGQYRVIFGDLSIKNVTPEELAELEKPLLEQ